MEDVKPIFGSKMKSKKGITLVEGTKIIQEEGELAYSRSFSSVISKVMELMKIFSLLLPLAQEM